MLNAHATLNTFHVEHPARPQPEVIHPDDEPPGYQIARDRYPAEPGETPSEHLRRAVDTYNENERRLSALVGDEQFDERLLLPEPPTEGRRT